MRSFCLLALLLPALVMLSLSCDADTVPDGRSTNPPEATDQGEQTAAPTPTATSPSAQSGSQCSDDLQRIASAFDAYYAANSVWPTADGGPGDVDWTKLVPESLDEIPVTDADCDWQVNTAPEGTVCIFDKESKPPACYCASVCTQPPPAPGGSAAIEDAPPPQANPISSQSVTGTIRWVGGWEDAAELAEAENRLIMINFYTDVCPYCKKMYRNTFSDEGLGQFLMDNFVLVKSNTHKEDLHSRYGIKSVPSTLFVTADGEEIPDTRMVGSRSVDQVRTRAEEVLATYSKGVQGSNDQ